MKPFRLLPGGLLAAALTSGCGWEAGDNDAFPPAGPPAVVARRGTVVLDGCAPNPSQLSTLQSASMQAIVQDVVFLCFTFDTTGAAQPSDDPSRAAFAAVAKQVKAIGYTVKAGVSLSGDTGAMYNTAATAVLFQNADWTQAAASSIVSVAPLADGVDLDFQGLPDSVRDDLTNLVSAVSRTIRPAKALEIFVPPSVSIPSDLSDGDAFDIAALGGLVDRVRVMTLDYSTGTGGGPTIDSGWAVDAVNLAENQTGTAIDVSVPLYGWEFNEDNLAATTVTYAEAMNMAASAGVQITRSLGGELWFDLLDSQVWFDDARSTLLTLTALSSALPSTVGVLYYGLGSEDPAVWSTVAGATQP